MTHLSNLPKKNEITGFKDLEVLIPPNSKIIENAVIGALIIDPDYRDEAIAILNEGCFYNDLTRKLFSAIVALKKKEQVIDFATVSNAVKDDILPNEILEICDRTGSSIHLLKHSKILYELHIRRELIKLCLKLQKEAYDTALPIDELCNEHQNAILSLFRFDSQSILTLNKVMLDVVEIMTKNSQQSNVLTGIGTGFSEFDKFSGGLQKSDLVIIAGETSNGKTSFAMTIAKNAALMFDTKVFVCTLEMTHNQLAAKLMSQESGISGKDILTKKMDSSDIYEITSRLTRLDGAKIFFGDKTSTSVESILQSIRGMKTKHDIDLVVIDYLQLIGTTERGMNKEQQTAYISRSLKNVAKELDICVVLLSQLSRDKQNPIPRLSRLRDSGQIEEAADVIMLVYRPEASEKKNPKFPFPFENKDARSAAYIDVAKGRNIGTFQFLTSFNKRLTLFTDYKGGDYETPVYSPEKANF